MSDKSKSGGQPKQPLTGQAKEKLTAGRIIKLRLPTETNKPNPFMTGLNRPNEQQPTSRPTSSQGNNTSEASNTPKPTEPKK